MLQLGLGLALTSVENAAGGSGPTPPVWLPRAPSGDYASVFIDPVGQHFYQNGAECAVTDVVLSTTLYVPGTGFVADGVNVVDLIGQLQTIAGSGAYTIRLQFKGTGSQTPNDFSYAIAFEDAASSSEFSITLNSDSSGAAFIGPWGVAYDNYSPDGGQGNNDAQGTNLYASGSVISAVVSPSASEAAAFVLDGNGGLDVDSRSIGSSQTFSHYSLLGYRLDSGPTPMANMTVTQLALWATRQPDADLEAIAAL